MDSQVFFPKLQGVEGKCLIAKGHEGSGRPTEHRHVNRWNLRHILSGHAEGQCGWGGGRAPTHPYFK